MLPNSPFGPGIVALVTYLHACQMVSYGRMINFAQGVFVMLGGMFCHTALTRFGVPIFLAAIIAIPFVAAVGVLIDRFVVRPMWDRNATLFAIILATLAAQIMIERITILTLGDQPRTYPEFTAGGPLKLGGIAIGYQLFWILATAALMILLLWLFFTKTVTGRALRACSQNREAAALLGIPVSRMLMISFALSAALGAVAGILVTPTQYTAFNVGTPFGVNGFIAAIIGGFGHAGGALAGGLLLGLAQAIAIVLFGAGFKNVAALSLLLLVLLVFPSGLFGSSEDGK